MEHENETFSISSPRHPFYTLWICHIYTHLQTDLKRKATKCQYMPLCCCRMLSPIKAIRDFLSYSSIRKIWGAEYFTVFYTVLLFTRLKQEVLKINQPVFLFTYNPPYMHCLWFTSLRIPINPAVVCVDIEREQ